MKLIDKDALVAEIEKCYNECLKRAKITDSDYWNAKADAYRNVLVILDGTLEVKEVKEVDLETSIDDYINSHFTEGCDGVMISDWYKVLGGVHYKDLKEITKHFFELGIKANGHFAVYVVTRSEEHDDYVEEVFFDKDKAQEYCDQFKENENAYARHITKVEVTL